MSFGSASLRPGEQGKHGCNLTIAQPCARALQALVAVPQRSGAPWLSHRQFLVALAMARSMQPGGKYTSTPWGRDVWRYCGSAGNGRSARASGKAISPDELGFALEGTHGQLWLLGELVSCCKGPMAEPARAWSNSTARSHAEKHLTVPVRRNTPTC